MNGLRREWTVALGCYAAGLIVYWFTSPYIALAVPAIGMLAAMQLAKRGRTRQADPLPPAAEAPPVIAPSAAGSGAPAAGADNLRSAAAGGAGTPAAGSAAGATGGGANAPAIADPELAAAVEYIGVIQDMILLEGKKHNLDDEIVEKSSALLARLNRLIPDLAELGDSTINYNITRLVRRDLNSTINPFLRLSGEAKRQNRRVLLDGIKDIDSKLTFYTQTLEQKDLIELRTKAELIQQRYRIND